MLKISYIVTCISVSVVMAQPVNVTDYLDMEIANHPYTIISRAQWKARPAKETLALTTPVPYVTIHHSHTPAACHGYEECSAAMRTMQHMHMDDNGWWDVGYSFAVGSDGLAYEGRGWETLGAHALHFNTVSVGICLIGDWSSTLPPPAQLKTAKALIAHGVQQGYIRPDYRLVGHRQVRSTQCPGQALYEEIKTWHHFSNFPTSSADLLDIIEIPPIMKTNIKNELMSLRNSSSTALGK